MRPRISFVAVVAGLALSFPITGCGNKDTSQQDDDGNQRKRNQRKRESREEAKAPWLEGPMVKTLVTYLLDKTPETAQTYTVDEGQGDRGRVKAGTLRDFQLEDFPKGAVPKSLHSCWIAADRAIAMVGIPNQDLGLDEQAIFGGDPPKAIQLERAFVYRVPTGPMKDNFIVLTKPGDEIDQIFFFSKAVATNTTLTKKCGSQDYQSAFKQL